MTTGEKFPMRYRIPRLPSWLTKVSLWQLFVLLLIMASIRPSFPRGHNVIPQNKTQSTLAQSENNFTRDLYTKLAKNSNGNLFFSPMSVMTALGMTLAGARGNTKAQMQNTMYLEDDDDVHDAFNAIIADIKTVVPEYELRIANMAYISDQLGVLAAYVEVLTKKYLSSSEMVNFDEGEAVRQIINSAVEKETNSRIKDLIPQGVLNTLTRLVLVNAVYFKGFWENQFKEKNTKEGDFWISTNTSVKVPMMSIKKKFGYAVNRDLGAKLLRMKYQGSRLSMVFVLPDERAGLAGVEAKLATANLHKLIEDMRDIEIEVKIPKFKLEESFDLGETLIEMGMQDLFSELKADLSGMSNAKGIYVSKVIHKAFLEVNEKGSEAAAATAIVIKQRSMPLPPQRFTADHPFIFYIKDEASGLVLFSGRLVSPVPTTTNSRDEL